jgi:chaperonin cofactor prefoldin
MPRARRDDLAERVERLENLVEGLQDAMHRESVRHDELIEQLQKKTEPAEIARALSEDARKRGL